MADRRPGILSTAAAFATLALNGCVVGPQYAGPSDPTAESKSFVASGVRQDACLLGKMSNAPTQTNWWISFHDPLLARLEERIADANLDVRTATLRIAESRAQVASTSAAALPRLDGTGSDYRQAFSKNALFKLIPTSILGSGSGGSSISQINTGYNTYTVGFDASWEIDLWGHVAKQIEAAQALNEADEEARRDTLVSSQAELAREYLTLSRLLKKAARLGEWIVIQSPRRGG